MQFRKRLCNEGLQNNGHLCAQVQSKTWKRIQNERVFSFKASVYKVNYLACFGD